MNNNNIRRNKSKIDDSAILSTHYSLFISVIAVGILNLIINLVGILSDGIIYIVKNDSINALATISMHYVLTILILVEICIIFYCLFYTFHALNKKSNSILDLKSYLLLIFQCIIYSFFLFTILISFILAYDLTKCNLFYSILVAIVAIVAMYVYYISWKWTNKKHILIVPNLKAVKYTTMLIIMFLSGSFYYCTYIVSPIKIEKNIYTFQDQEAIIKIPGYASSIEVVRDGGGIIPFRTYYLDYNVYLIIDFSSLLIVEGNYHVKATINGTNSEKEFVYIFKGTWDDKNKYIDKYFIRAKNEINDNSKEDILLILKEAALSGNKNKYNNLLNSMVDILPPKAIGVLKELSLDKALFNK